MLNAVKQKVSGQSSKKSAEPSEGEVVFRLRDYNADMVSAWRDSFSQHTDSVEISHGDIFKEAPSADAIVSPANSFGFMDGGIDMAYSRHFGWQLMRRLQEEIITKKNGELLVGEALIIPIYRDEEAQEEAQTEWTHEPECYNEGKPIRYLISAPTMRVPQDVTDTVHAYLAFRAVILAVKQHNADSSKEPIHSVLCPGLGTAVGRMPKPVCAKQMLQAYETFHLGLDKGRVKPQSLHAVCVDDSDMKCALIPDDYAVCP